LAFTAAGAGGLNTAAGFVVGAGFAGSTFAPT
jgi:hypothetical protein